MQKAEAEGTEKHRDLEPGAFLDFYYGSLLVPIRDTTLCQVIWRKFYVDAIAHQNPNTVPTHAARDRRKHDMLAVLDLHFEKSVRLLIDHHTG